jgi:ABC-type multidrug transport system fused ATPase/permease subunit
MRSETCQPSAGRAPLRAEREQHHRSPLWGTLGALLSAYWRRILLTYALFNLENGLRLAQPLVLGLAMNDLFHASYAGLLLFIGLHLAYLFLGCLRRMYDTRAFTGIYTDLATQLVLGQRGRDEPVSRVAARSALSREIVDFFERDVPLAVRALYSVVGALALLVLYDALLAPFCLALLLPTGVINWVHGRWALWLNGRLNDQFEGEVEVIARCRQEETRGHYALLASWRVKLSDWEALTFSLMELFVLGLLVVTLVRSCGVQEMDPGNVLAVFRYVLMFITGLDSVPLLVQQFGRLRDIGGRMQHQVPGPELRESP